MIPDDDKKSGGNEGAIESCLICYAPAVDFQIGAKNLKQSKTTCSIVVLFLKNPQSSILNPQSSIIAQ
eukprot:scaffold47215_cov51-Attheya_sp.AAC.5